MLKHSGFDVRWDVFVLPLVRDVERSALGVKTTPPSFQYGRGEVGGAYCGQRGIERLRICGDGDTTGGGGGGNRTGGETGEGTGEEGLDRERGTIRRVSRTRTHAYTQRVRWNRNKTEQQKRPASNTATVNCLTSAVAEPASIWRTASIKASKLR